MTQRPRVRGLAASTDVCLAEDLESEINVATTGDHFTMYICVGFTMYIYIYICVYIICMYRYYLCCVART